MSGTDCPAGNSFLFTGASRSGKSALALQWAQRLAPSRIFLATGSAHDAEMRDRIARHQAERGHGWSTVELDPMRQGSDLCAMLEAIPHPYPVVVDCTTMWLASLMDSGLNNGAIMSQIACLAELIPQLPFPVALVHNETGWGVVPEYSSGRRFRDLSGFAGQCLARTCSTVVLAVCGIPVTIKGSWQS